MGQNFPTKNVNAQTPDFVQEKTGQNIIGQGFPFSARSDLQSDRYKYEHL